MLKRSLFIFILSLIHFIEISAQKIYQVMYEEECDVQIMIVADESECDLKVFFVDDVEKSSKPGCWFVCDFPEDAETKIFFTEDAAKTDIKIFIVEEESQAGWKNEKKRGIM